MKLVIRWKRDAARVPAACVLALVVLAGGALMRLTVKERIGEQHAAATALAAHSGSRIARALALAPGVETCARDRSTLESILSALDAGRLAGSGFDYQLSCMTPGAGPPRVIARSTERDLAAPVRHFSYGNTSVWSVALAPATGWVPWRLIVLQSLLVFVTALFAVLATVEIARRPEQLRLEVRARDRRLKAVHQRLAAEIQLREALESQISRLPGTLGGLADRGYLTDRLTRAQQRAVQDPAASVAVMVISFGRLTPIDDARWRSADEVLMRQAVERLRGCLGAREHAIARVADDAVGLLLVGVTSGESARAEAELLQQALATSFTIAGQRVFVNAHMGIALGVSGYEGAEELLRGAQLALEQAIADAGTRVAVLNPAARKRPLTRQQPRVDRPGQPDGGEVLEDAFPLVRTRAR